MLPLVFQKVPLRVIEALEVTRLLSQATHVLELDKNVNFVSGKVESSPRTATVLESFRYGAKRFFERQGRS